MASGAVKDELRSVTVNERWWAADQAFEITEKDSRNTRGVTTQLGHFLRTSLTSRLVRVLPDKDTGANCGRTVLLIREAQYTSDRQSAHE